MKRILSLVAAILMIAATLCSSGSVLASEAVDTQGISSLTITYKYGDTLYEGLEIEIYRVAGVSESFEFYLTGAFSEYPVNLYGISSQAEWRNITETLVAYAVADKINPTAVGVTDASGNVSFTNLMPGIYLVMGVRHEDGGEITVFESFLAVVPRPNDDGEYIYDVHAIPKSEHYVPTGGEIEYKVVKMWRDGGMSETRTDHVTVDIFRDGEFVESVVLSDANNWMYTWTANDDGSVWSVIEREIPDKYAVNITTEGRTFIITNNYDGEEDAPQTGESINTYLYAVLMCISGAVVVTLSFGKRRAVR